MIAAQRCILPCTQTLHCPKRWASAVMLDNVCDAGYVCANASSKELCPAGHYCAHGTNVTTPCKDGTAAIDANDEHALP